MKRPRSAEQPKAQAAQGCNGPCATSWRHLLGHSVEVRLKLGVAATKHSKGGAPLLQRRCPYPEVVCSVLQPPGAGRGVGCRCLMCSSSQRIAKEHRTEKFRARAYTSSCLAQPAQMMQHPTCKTSALQRAACHSRMLRQLPAPLSLVPPTAGTRARTVPGQRSAPQRCPEPHGMQLPAALRTRAPSRLECHKAPAPAASGRRSA